MKSWYLFFSRGQVVFSGFNTINFENILSILNNYLPLLRDKKAIHLDIIQSINKKYLIKKDIIMVGLLRELALCNENLEYQQFSEAIQSHIVADVETYFFSKVKEAKLVSDRIIDYSRPILGLKIDRLCSSIKSRRSEWLSIKKAIPSLNSQVKCNSESSTWKQLSIPEKIKIRKLLNSGNTIEEIRYSLGEDSLKVAQIFSKLIAKNLVVITKDFQKKDQERALFPTKKESSAIISPQLVIIDDSLVLLKQFSSVVQQLGYRVKCCDNALNAVKLLLENEPALIFIDINMPALSGFQLIKQIRSQPKLSTTPLVILTAEKNMMNQQRAKWSRSSFLSKPLHTEDIARFTIELKVLLQNLAPITL